MFDVLKRNTPSIVERSGAPVPPAPDHPRYSEGEAVPSHLIVVGNEKGGAGKSTVTMHLAMALMKMGATVGALDLDVHQRTFSRYLDNRRRWSAHNNVHLGLPEQLHIDASGERDLNQAEADERARFTAAVAELKSRCQFVLVDAPGNDTFLSRLAHEAADTLITPLNDSFVDLDLLGEINPETMEVVRPSYYSEFVWECRIQKVMREKRQTDWVLMRNRMSPLDARNKHRVGEALKSLSQRIGFRIAPGLSERVIFRELFPMGMTLLDVADEANNVGLTMSHVAARQELRDMLIVLKLPGLAGKPILF